MEPQSPTSFFGLRVPCWAGPSETCRGFLTWNFFHFPLFLLYLRSALCSIHLIFLRLSLQIIQKIPEFFHLRSSPHSDLLWIDLSVPLKRFFWRFWISVLFVLSVFFISSSSWTSFARNGSLWTCTSFRWVNFLILFFLRLLRPWRRRKLIIRVAPSECDFWKVSTIDWSRHCPFMEQYKRIRCRFASACASILSVRQPFGLAANGVLHCPFLLPLALGYCFYQFSRSSELFDHVEFFSFGQM